ncbi:MAG: non-canonical purine NTP pyrophosphatase [Halobacteriovoraceae bacterium]|nr:non-canonical purine NTP pyrophosphatase [Halobacteriovoraceae bacterium]|tara:strand:+ start:1167 stop:1748 length:582 start_codon:yes stop_codon:yes gene_type:complete
MNFLLASSNTHKAQELNELLAAGNLEITSAAQKIDVVEDGKTFQENAFKKAEAYFKEFKTPTVADDSGLVIPKRPDILGIHSARFAPECGDYQDKNKRLLEEISALKNEERKAYFVCYLCFYLSSEEVYFFEGRVHGTIGHEAKGTDGFGYDPIFYPDGQGGKALAEVSEWKMKNSHRAKACESAVKFFKEQK